MCDILLKNRQTQAVALGTTPQNVVPFLADMFDLRPTPCTIVDDGPVKEKKLIGERADLYDIPICIHSEGDGGRYIGSGMCITKDPETGLRNVACLRMQVKGPRKTGLMMVPRHTFMHYEKYQGMGKPMPMAVAIGHHPLYEIATNYCTTYGVDELELAGSFLGKSAELVRCETIDLEAPAHAEMIMECEVLPNVREQEGPFGEFQGYMGTGDGLNQVVEVKAITMRHDAIFRHLQATNISDHHALVALPMEARLYKELKDVEGYIDLKDVHVPYWGGCFLTIIQMTPHFEGQAKDVLLAGMSSSYLHPKVVVAVDEDVNIYDPREVMWAISTRVNPTTDVITVAGTRNHPMDPSVPQLLAPGGRWQRVGGKMGIDATKPSTSFPERRRVFDRVVPKGHGTVKLSDFV
jgi:2,5-furandicarboxylate decarboxylase 1